MLKRSARCLALWMTVSLLCAAEFRTGQAARAVLGQPSFTAYEKGILAQSMVFANGKLYAADAVSGRVLTFDHIPGAGDDPADSTSSGCVVCGFSPNTSTIQPVSPMAAQYSSFGNAVAIVDTINRRVLLWRDNHSLKAAYGPDVILEADSDGSPIDNSTLVEPVSVALDGTRLFVGDKALRRVLVWNTLPTTGDQGADAVLGQSSFTALDSTTTGPDRFAYPQALVSDGTNLYVADGGNRRILVFSPSDIPLTSDAVVNSASFKAGPLAPGTLVTIHGQHLSEASETTDDDGEHSLPTKLAGVQVLLDGRPLPLASVSPVQIQVQLPYVLNGAESSLYVRSELGNGTVATTNAVAIQTASVSPGIFALSGSEPRSGMLLHAQANTTVPNAPVTRDDPAKPGETLTIWAAGLGVINASDFGKGAQAGQPYSGPDAETQTPVEAYVNGQSVPVLHAALAQGAVGIYEVQVLLPVGIPLGSSSNLLIAQAGVSSNTVTFPVAPAIH